MYWTMKNNFKEFVGEQIKSAIFKGWKSDQRIPEF
jgi:hypothetical protein